MNHAIAATGPRELNFSEIEQVSGGVLGEIANEIFKRWVIDGVNSAVQQSVGWIQAQITNARQTGVAGQPGYVDAMGNASGVSTMVEGDNKDAH